MFDHNDEVFVDVVLPGNGIQQISQSINQGMTNSAAISLTDLHGSVSIAHSRDIKSVKITANHQKGN